MTLIKILDSAKNLEISSLVLHCFTFLFASKLLKNSAKVFRAIHENLLQVYGSLEDVEQHEEAINKIIWDLFCIMFSMKGTPEETLKLANGIKNSEVIPSLFEILQKIGTDDMKIKYIGYLRDKAILYLKNRIKLVENDAGVFISNYIHSSNAVLADCAVEFAALLLSAHCRRKDVQHYMEEIIKDPKTSENYL